MAAPGKTLDQGIHLIVMTSGKRQQFSGEVLKPRSLAWKSNRAAGKQVGLRNDPRTLVGLRSMRGDVDRLLAQALDKATTDVPS